MPSGEVCVGGSGRRGWARLQCIEFEQVWVMGTIREVYFNTSSTFINCAFSSTSILLLGSRGEEGTGRGDECMETAKKSLYRNTLGNWMPNI